MIYDCVPSFYFLSIGVLCWVIFVKTKVKLCLEIPTDLKNYVPNIVFTKNNLFLINKTNKIKYSPEQLDD